MCKQSGSTELYYMSPLIEELDISLLTIICTSPEEGGTEDIGYEDWVL